MKKSEIRLAKANNDQIELKPNVGKIGKGNKKSSNASKATNSSCASKSREWFGKFIEENERNCLFIVSVTRNH